MNKTYKLDNGWIVKKVDNNPAILYVTPLKNSVFNKKQKIEIKDSVFEAIALGEVKELFKKYKLHKIIIENSYTDVTPTSINLELKNTENKFIEKTLFLQKKKMSFLLNIN